ncbi:hypothetical protein T05_13071 [Trichinella murrelli]|uniref:Uncharacterized protein n=1 Tax=Trichinella murrelli TaxID=144512 RepID=A0A0V0UCN4_9BILA|nr:hypothetical protein T05_13071 [Trichinella murrelli]
MKTIVVDKQHPTQPQQPPTKKSGALANRGGPISDGPAWCKQQRRSG